MYSLTEHKEKRAGIYSHSCRRSEVHILNRLGIIHTEIQALSLVVHLHANRRRNKIDRLLLIKNVIYLSKSTSHVNLNGLTGILTTD